MKKLMVATGYMGSGSSAVTDLLAEYKDCFNEYKSFEYVFLHCPNGLFDLEDHLLIGNNAIKSDASIRLFEEQMKKLYDKPFWWAGNYKKIIGPKFMDYTEEFVEKITQFKFSGFWYYQEEVNFNMFLKLLVRKPFKMITKNKCFNKPVLKYNDGMKLSYIKPEEFYPAAKEYINKVLNEASKGHENIIMDQLLLPFNLFRVDNYFGDELKVIVVDRDPRDVYIINKYIWPSRKITVPFPTDAEKFCEVYKNMREMEKPFHSEKVLRIHFEDLIYKYDDTVKKIEKFIGFKPEDHINKKTRFIPEMSIKNTQIYSSEVYKDEIKIIENKLKSYLYNFPYKIDNKVEETVEFD